MSRAAKSAVRAVAPVALAALALLAATALALAPTAPRADAEQRSLLLATTTSVQDSGLLDAVLPAFTEATGIRVRAVAVGTGAALRMGSEGNADVLLTHAPAAERKLVESGAVDRRVEIMTNHFVLAGPPADPAGARSAGSILEALRTIRNEQAPFVSRADDSGTHKREVALFRAAGLDPTETWPSLTRTGSGMGLSLQVAGQKGAYILADIGTFLAFEDRTGLATLSGSEPALRNVYSLLRVSPAKFPNVHSAEADAFIAHSRRPETRSQVAEFGKARFDRALFSPIEPDTP